MSESTAIATRVAADLSTMHRDDTITLDSLPAYIRAVQESVKSDSAITYGRTLVYRAAAALGFMYQTDEKGQTVRHNGEPVVIYGDKFVAKDYADFVGVSPAMVSTWALLSLAVDQGITPESKSDRDGERFAAITQNATGDVRKVLRNKKASRPTLDAVLFPKAKAKKEARAQRAKGGRRKATHRRGPGEGALDALKAAVADLKVSDLTANEMADLDKIVTRLRSSLDSLKASTPPRAVRGGRRKTAA